uniref:Alpha-carbonic anhydrase domain-containing protein n=1 Tax=Sphaeramia orbicularis TaxID=375764 RepID=A0A673AMF9_9TELE
NFPMKWFVVALAVCTTASMVFGAWCYHLPECNYNRWPQIAPKYCDGCRQSPINIVSSKATGDPSLGAFTFHGFDSTSAMTKIENTGKTVKVTLAGGVGVEGGGLSERYDSLQFHLHWGNGASVPGSEHTVDGKRYPMEVAKTSANMSYNRYRDSTGLAALGFLIDVRNYQTGQPEAWRKLTSYLHNIKLKGQSIAISSAITLNQLLSGVDRTKYYRYLGSLTTPTCNEAVVWTNVHIIITQLTRIQPDQPVRTQGTAAPHLCTKRGLTLLWFVIT